MVWGLGVPQYCSGLRRPKYRNSGLRRPRITVLIVLYCSGLGDPKCWESGLWETRPIVIRGPRGPELLYSSALVQPSCINNIILLLVIYYLFIEAGLV